MGPRVPSLQALIERHAPGAELVEVRELGADSALADTTLKAAGYGKPLRVTLRRADGGRERWVLHTATANEYGHDRRSDRFAATLLASDTYDHIPGHVRALDVGTFLDNGTMLSLAGSGEAYLLTRWAEGDVYAEDLRRVGARGLTNRDVERARALGDYLATLHTPLRRAHAYRRSVRDVVGSGEGIYGIVDGYPDDVPAAPPARLGAIEARAATWRWRLRGAETRLVRIHGDFHPFNIVFDERSTMTLLDASRGCAGDAADDVTALSINYLFFALQERSGAYRALWRRFWQAYLAGRSDPGLLAAAPLYWTWRTLVLCNPRWYPDVDRAVRDRLLRAAEHMLDAGGLSLDACEELFP